MLRYTATIFLSAFLLFLVQPMIARFILPWYGGSAVVWTTCMMFFQVVLLLGYLYCHLVRRFLTPRITTILHGLLLLAAIFLLRTAPPESLRPVGGDDLTWSIVKLLLFTVGLPFFVLTTTSPLVQAWHSLSHGGRTYRLYAVSNLGSILALLCYPFLFEPLLPLQTQAAIWVWSFAGFAVLCAVSGIQTLRYDGWGSDMLPALETDGEVNQVSTKPGPGAIVLWCLLAMTPSIVLLATTNLMCQEVASIPFLWILPLSLYLLSLIICFDRPGLYKRTVFLPLLCVGAIAATLVLILGSKLTLLPQMITLAIVCFSSGMVCHGELERIKPDASNLTLFYLMVSVGGALGGIFVAVVAPRIFNDYYEFQIGLVLSLLLPVGLMVRAEIRKKNSRPVRMWGALFGSLIAVTCVVCSLLFILFDGEQETIQERVRNEYGLVQIVVDPQHEGGEYKVMVNGRTDHGGQFIEPEKQMLRSGYYVRGAGAELAITTARKLKAAAPGETGAIRVGVIGLGTGSLVSWLKPDDEIWFFEINPVVERMAREHFTYLDSRDPELTHVITGDGRTRLEQLLTAGESLNLDVLCIDAFTSDSIPAHLLTEECFEIYLKHLNPDGIICSHITNTFVDMRPVLFGQAEKFDLHSVLIDNDRGTYETRWVLLTANESVLLDPEIIQSRSGWPDGFQGVEWTDDFSSLASLVDWSVGLDLKLDELPERESPEAPADSNR